ncbi:hypothetical protein ITJ38_17610 [Agreia pratensis]|uniref:hypothetical protein n=1 Tax=Agreia pratensis TaxID=150121 RepID=UPI00188BE723|nr:hypothetical protein [Agreia pratensis]MBF4636231.1 hypothetical protein [Agreia pratensis]
MSTPHTPDKGPTDDETPNPNGVSDTLDSAGAEAASAVAEKAMTAFVDRARPYDLWWPDVSQYLGPEARYAYEYTDPAKVPASAVTGAAVVSATPSATQVTVLIPTDIGQYNITLNRQNRDGEWTITRLTPPEGRP